MVLENLYRLMHFYNCMIYNVSSYRPALSMHDVDWYYSMYLTSGVKYDHVFAYFYSIGCSVRQVHIPMFLSQNYRDIL